MIGSPAPLFSGSPFDFTSPILIKPIYHRPDDPVWYWSGDGLFAAVSGEEPVQIYPITPDEFWPSPTQRDLFFFVIKEGETAQLFAFRTGEESPTLVDETIPSPNQIDLRP